jgi:ferredoxin/flavodoxin
MDKVEIYYFSGTGNSFVVARDIAKILDGNLISIASISKNDRINSDAKVIGIIYPNYYGSSGLSIPLLVKKFVLKLENLETKYIFAICTFGGGIGQSLNRLNSLMKTKGGTLSAGYGVHMPQNAFNKPWVNNLKLIKKWDAKKEKICKDIQSWKIIKFEEDSFSFRLLGSFMKLFIDFKLLEKKHIAKCAHQSMELPVEKLILFTDNSFRLNENCNGCGICLKVCPVDNIKMIDKKPKWQNHCENCLACYNWCPQKAIHGSIAEDYHYNNPNVKASDLMNLKYSNISGKEIMWGLE